MKSLIKKLVFSLLLIAQTFRQLISQSGETYKLLFIPGFESFRWNIGKWKAWMVFEKAKKEVPAYKEFLKEHAKNEVLLKGISPDFSLIPITDKESYIKKYSIEDRCLQG